MTDDAKGDATPAFNRGLVRGAKLKTDELGEQEAPPSTGLAENLGANERAKPQIDSGLPRRRAAEKRAPRTTITVYLLSEGVEAADDAIRPELGLDHRTVTAGELVGDLYIQQSDFSRPRWLQFLEGAADLSDLRLTTSSPAAVLVLPASGRLLALTFGHGRYLLRAGAFEERFGLRATLNAIEPKSIRSIDKKSFDALARHVQEQASRAAEASDFGLDVEQDLLRAVTGTARDPAFATRLSGKDALVANVGCTLAGLGPVLERCVVLSSDASYRREFPWVDHIAEISDPAKKQELDSRLTEQLRSRTFDRLWLALPQPVDWSQVDGFQFSTTPSASRHPDLHVHDFMGSLRDPSAVTVATLRGKRAYCIPTDGVRPLDDWSVYSCVYFEVDDGPDTFLLSGGKWYRIERSFVRQVNNAVSNIPRSSLALPPCDDLDEGEYNRKVAGGNSTYFTLLDADNVIHGGGSSKVEVCDLLTRDNRLVHVKKYASSSVLSHLFAQALVSGELLFMDGEFRKKVNAKLASMGSAITFPEDSLQPRDYEVVLGIITWSTKPLELPFFSRVNLQAAERRLRGFGYRVSLLPIPGRRE